MRRLFLIALVLACGCQKSQPVAQVKPTEPAASQPDSTTKAPRRTKRVPLAQRPDRSMVPLPPPPPPPPKEKPRLLKEEAAAAVQLFLTTQGATTAAVGNSKEAQENRPQNTGGGYSDVQVTAVGDPKEYPQLAETKKIGWVVAVSFSANNPRLKCRMRAKDHLFLLSRPADDARPLVYFHGSSEALAKARLGEEWYILNRPPRPDTETFP